MGHQTGDSIQGSHTASVKTNTAFFKKLEKKFNDMVKDESKKMADDMQFVLKLRSNLKGQGGARYPKWQESKPPSNRSYAGWKKYELPSGNWAIRNDTTSRVGDFSYVKLLAKGADFSNAPRGWAVSAASGLTADGSVSKLVMNNMRIFSKQLPQGLDPWLKVKRKDFKNRIELRTKEL